ncbi:T9SS type A sorting domain-containing protein [Croceiramulus getboli]|nr:T9SS type A sorting domain-containing protein [Flavobacteriaceae bacterium YJPT1-3]
MKSFKHTFFAVLLLVPAFAKAQFEGGPEDGSSKANLIGSQLDGDIASFAVLYQGSSGDGFDSQYVQTALGSSPFSSLYTGGVADGFSVSSSAAALGGSTLNGLYSGGNGDGHDKKAIQVFIAGQLATYFGGGEGDGASTFVASDFLITGMMTMLYEGGLGDGHAAELSAENFLSGLMLTLYQGGIGDGSASWSSETALTLDVAEALIQLDLVLYPNPASDLVLVEVPNNEPIIELRLYDAVGREVPIKIDDNNIIKVSSLADGLYLVHMTTAQGRVVKKLLVKK